MQTPANISVLFLGKRDDAHCERALAFVRSNFANVLALEGSWGDPFPEEIHSWEGDYIISYLSRWVVPGELLGRARMAAVNFHPAPPEYPGIGCINFALYDDAKDYGVTCHHMRPAVDTGEIIATRRFPVFPSDGVASLLARTHDIQLALFYEILSGVLTGHGLPKTGERWTRRPFTRAEFNELRRITPDMSAEEVRRRIRATSFGMWQPEVEVGGYLFRLKAQESD